MSITINRVIEIIANDNEVTTLYVLSFFNNHHVITRALSLMWMLDVIPTCVVGIGVLEVFISVLFQIINSYSSKFIWLVYLNKLPKFKYIKGILGLNGLEKTSKLILVRMPNYSIIIFSSCLLFLPSSCLKR